MASSITATLSATHGEGVSAGSDGTSSAAITGSAAATVIAGEISGAAFASPSSEPIDVLGINVTNLENQRMDLPILVGGPKCECAAVILGNLAGDVEA